MARRKHKQAIMHATRVVSVFRRCSRDEWYRERNVALGESQCHGLCWWLNDLAASWEGRVIREKRDGIDGMIFVATR